MALTEYTAKRKFERTPEPAPGPEGTGSGLRFVVHKHAARSLHYDLRLELEGVLKSWAVPKGPSLDPTIKRLALMVEDHPLEYRDFEGVIPEDNYGAGSVIIWDRGSYHSPAAQDREESRKRILEGLQKGNIKFVLEGEKLHGEFALVRTRKDGKSWLLMKKRDRSARGGEIVDDMRSVVSHKSLEDLLDTGRTGQFEQRKAAQIRRHEAIEKADLRDAPVMPMPQDIRPMLAAAAEGPFDHADWIFEVKWDGYRALAEVRETGVSLYSRNGISFSRKFFPIVESLRKLGHDAVLDGEVVVVDDQGRPDFQALQHYQASPGRHLLYCVFDLLYFHGHDLTSMPLLRRKELLKEILPGLPHIRYSGHVSAEGVLFYTAATEKGLEGVIAKHAGSTYQPGTRSRQWLKVKAKHTQEGVIAGFTEPGGGRSHFGALVLGLFEGGELVSIGGVGSGFSETDLAEIRTALDPLVQKEIPFTMPPETAAPVAWVRPELVCEVEVTGWTGDGIMRHPVFLRMRWDKPARDVVRELPLPGGKGGPG